MLKKINRTGYPFEFFLARIYNKKNVLITTIDYLKRSPEIIPNFDWNNFNLNFRKEIINIYCLIEEKERKILRNIFLVFEINNIISLIRYTIYGRREKIQNIFFNSLLDNNIQNICLGEVNLSIKLKNLMSFFSEINKDIINLLEVYTKKGLRAFEESFTKLFFEGLVRDRENIEEVENFIKKFIDYININSLWKKNYWDSQIDPLFIKGGFLSIEKIKEEVMNDKNFNSDKYLRKIVIYFLNKRFQSDYYLFMYYIANLYIENQNLNILFNTFGLLNKETEIYL